ncbi:MAG: hypothetical protein QOD39_4727, partial [Mycobacterium sp.]|nr:hypothetical protein [Mycobacterium sp.]
MPAVPRSVVALDTGVPTVGLEPERPLLGLLLGRLVAGLLGVVTVPLVARAAATRMIATEDVGAVGIGDRRSRLGERNRAADRLDMLFVVDMKAIVRKA